MTTKLIACLSLFVALCVVGIPVVQGSTKVCLQSPKPWTADGVDPMAEARSQRKIVVLALMEARACGICVRQAKAMESLRYMLEKRESVYKFGGLSFMVVNHHSAKWRIHHIRDRVGFPVYQDTANKIWSAVNGTKDDVIVYDKCGRLTAHLNWPKSNFAKPYVWRSLNRAKRSRCCKEETKDAKKN